MGSHAHRTYGIAIVVAVLVVMAGCSGPFQSSDASTDDPTETTEPTVTTTAATEAGDADDASATNETGSAITGRMLLLLDGSDTHVDPWTSNRADGVWMNDTQTHRWHVENDSTTLAAALGELGVEATADSLAYDGETYNESTNGTTVAYRVDGTVVEDPSEYQLEDGDEVHVLVHTANVSVPGREYSSSHPHAHGAFEASIDGEEVNFSKERYVMNDDYFHFHGDEDGSRWHAHSTNLTVRYAISSFDEFDVANGSITINETTYDADQTTFRVNGESVDPARYVLKDGDRLELVVDESG